MQGNSTVLCRRTFGHSHATQPNCLGALQAALFDEFESTRPLLEVLLQLDKQRLLAWAALPPPPQPQAAAGDLLSTHQLHALFELLGYSHYLDDAELCAAAVGLLHHVSWALETSEGTPYAGLLRLLAHPGSHVRSQVIRRLLQDCAHRQEQQQRESPPHTCPLLFVSCKHSYRPRQGLALTQRAVSPPSCCRRCLL